MVLEDATADAGIQSDERPPSDTDAFSSDQSDYNSRYNIDSSRFHKPIPILAPLVGVTEAYQQNKVSKAVQFYNAILQRERGRTLTSVEAQAVAEHYSRVISTESYGRVLGAAFALRLCWKGRATYRLPLWQPKLNSFNPNEFGPFRGAVSRAVLHTIRGTSYYGLGYFLGGYFAMVWGAAGTFRGLRADDRTKELFKLVHEQGTAQRPGPQSRRDSARTNPRSQESKPERQSSSVNKPWPPWTQTSNRPSSDDDMSPTSGSFYEDYTSSSNSSESSRWSGEQGSTNESKYHSTSDTRGRASQAQRSSPESLSSSTSAQSSSSPWPGNHADSTSSSPSPSASSWEQIRQRASGGSQEAAVRGDAAQSSQSAGTSPYDSFSFSSTEEDKSLAKAEAQREFDARVERERQGKDFSSGESGRRW